MRALADGARVRRLMRELGARAAGDTRVYFTGGATAVLHGWRDAPSTSTFASFPIATSCFRAILELKERLQVNIELASPDEFIPVREGWEDRSPFAAREGRVSFHHFDLDAQRSRRSSVVTSRI